MIKQILNDAAVWAVSRAIIDCLSEHFDLVVRMELLPIATSLVSGFAFSRGGLNNVFSDVFYQLVHENRLGLIVIPFVFLFRLLTVDSEARVLNVSFQSSPRFPLLVIVCPRWCLFHRQSTAYSFAERKRYSWRIVMFMLVLIRSTG